MVAVLNIISRLGKNLKKEKNMKRFGVLYGDTNYQTKEKRQYLPQYYILVFLMRRFLYVLIILFIFKYPILQQACNITLHTLTFIYDIIMRPFPIGVVGMLIYFFDFILVIIFGSLPLYMAFSNYAEDIGRVHIYLLIVTIILSWIIIFCVNIRTIYRKFQRPVITVEEITKRIEDENRVVEERIAGEQTMRPRRPRILVQNNYYVHGQKKNKNKSNIRIKSVNLD